MLKLDETVKRKQNAILAIGGNQLGNSKHSEECTVHLTGRGNIDDDPGPRTE